MKYYNEIRTHLSLDKDAPCRAPLSGPDIFFAARSWAGCITNMSGFDLRQAQPADQRHHTVRQRLNSSICHFGWTF